jgi:hypothetical protein
MRSWAAALPALLLQGGAAATEERSSPLASSSFELLSNTPLVEVAVEGRGPLRFVLDTGAGASVIDRGRAEALGLKLSAPGGRAAWARDVAVSIAGVDLPRTRLLAVPLDLPARRAGFAIDGILGRDIFARYVVEIDYDARTVRLDNPKGYRPAGGGEMLALSLADDVPYVRAQITPVGGAPIEDRFLIDTGASKTLTLSHPFVERHRLRRSLPIIPGFDVTLDGESRTSIGRLQRLELGSLGLDAPVVVLAERPGGAFAEAGFAGRIGGGFLRRFTVVMDYPHRRMQLVPNAHIGDPDELDMSGIVWIADPTDLAVLTVQHVLEGSPAAEAQIQQGDVLVSVDGKSVATMDSSQRAEVFTGAGQERVLRIRRGRTEREVRLKLRRLI